MNKKKIQKEFYDFLDTASEEQLRDFLKFMRNKNQRDEKSSDAMNFPEGEGVFKKNKN